MAQYTVVYNVHDPLITGIFRISNNIEDDLSEIWMSHVVAY